MCEFWHPPFCEFFGLCEDVSKDHRLNYLHPIENCKFGGICKLINDDYHVANFVHPPMCNKKNYLNNIIIKLLKKVQKMEFVINLVIESINF
jgi:hypothetical protein